MISNIDLKSISNVFKTTLYRMLMLTCNVTRILRWCKDYLMLLLTPNVFTSTNIECFVFTNTECGCTISNVKNLHWVEVLAFLRQRFLCTERKEELRGKHIGENAGF